MSDAVLALSASAGPCTCALRTPEGTLLVDSASQGGAAARVAGLCARARVAPEQITELRLDLGPGSYTGLRVAVTFARTLLELAAVEVRAASSIELIALLAWQSLGAPPDAIVRPVLDARRGRVHHAPARLGATVMLLAPPAAEPVESLRARIGPDEVVVTDSDLQVPARSTLRLAQSARAALVEQLFDARIALRRMAAAELEPLYLMGTYVKDEG